MQRSIEKLLHLWKEDTSRLPLILRGARQVGKSYVIEKFGSEKFKFTVIANFDFQPELASCFEDLNPHTICSRLELILNQSIIPGQTLLFLDEIQNCPKAVSALRYFKEKLPSLHVIAAGSLLEFILHEEQFSFPVGRVEFIYLRPFSFREFLMSQNQERLVTFLDSTSFTTSFEPPIHQHLMNFIRKFFLLGGLPAAIQAFLENQSFLRVQKILNGILETYRNDFGKYATKAQHKYLQIFFEKCSGLIGQPFKYSHIDAEIRSRELKVALDQLIWAGLIQRIIATNASGIPLQTHAKDNKFKLLFLDIGLMNTANRMDLNSIWETNINHLLLGAQAEQFVGQELLAYSDPFINTPLFYWERDKKGSIAEVDYVIQLGSKIIPIEVKAGTTGRLKSLSLFLNEKKCPFGIRISGHPLSFHDRILSIPFYLIEQLPRLVAELDH